MTIKAKYSIVIVGAGPVGAAMANLLGKYGVSTLIIDRETDVVEIPRAIGLCEEGSRVLAAAGVLDTFEPETLKINKIRLDEPYGTTMAHTDPSGLINGYPNMRTFYQPDMERCLRKSLDQYDHVDLSAATECVDFQDLGQSVKIILQKAGETFEVQCRYMIGSDGSASPTRKKLEIGFQGKTYGEDWIVFDAENNPEPDDQVALLCNRDRPGITMSAPDGRRRWEFILKDGDDREAILEDSSVAELLKPWGNAADMGLTRKTIYTFHARVADRFQRANVFLIGDAAHVTPPFAGQGLMAGFRDCYNLAWKIRDVLDGKISTDILASYDVERKPQVKQIIWFAKFIGSWLLPSNRLRSALRDGILKLGRTLGAHSDTKALPISKLSNHINGKLLRHLFIQKWKKTGFELPQFTVDTHDGESNLIDPLIDDRHYIIGFDRDPSEGLSDNIKARWHSIGGSFVKLVSNQTDQPNISETQGKCSVLFDRSGSYREFFGSPDKTISIRPDKIIMINCKASQLESRLGRYLSKIEAPEPITGPN